MWLFRGCCKSELFKKALLSRDHYLNLEFVLNSGSYVFSFYCDLSLVLLGDRWVRKGEHIYKNRFLFRSSIRMSKSYPFHYLFAFVYISSPFSSSLLLANDFVDLSVLSTHTVQFLGAI